ncbi:unnamed protein product [Cuscuta epithymum]|uniref:Retrotransposon Copia-like N-terminal domain-containing protein n=1 Tax=Cuscuta epithymum TaxID=186058 RepID=A0AAV0DAC0_9ASTE|nr:unnamed protein product [Cuscuta epithymum]
MNITPTTTVVPLTATTHFPIKLTTSNFPVWKCQVYSALVGLGLDAYIDGTIQIPEKFTDDAKTQINPCYTIWFRQDKTILSALLGSCSDTIQPVISSATSARNAWDKLTLTYASTSRGRIISLKTSLARTKKGSRSIQAYLTEMYALSEALALAQSPLSEEDLVINILNGLGPDYSELTSAIRVRETALPLEELQDILLEHEARLQENINSSDNIIPTAHVTQLGDRRIPHPERRSPSNNDRRGFPTRRGRGPSYASQPRSNANTTVCRFCDHIGHDVRQCRKLQRFLRDNQVPHPASPVVNHTATTPAGLDQPWLFDSGASHHVTANAANLPSYNDYGGPEEVHLGNGSSHGGPTNARGEH